MAASQLWPVVASFGEIPFTVWGFLQKFEGLGLVTSLNPARAKSPEKRMYTGFTLVASMSEILREKRL